MLTRKTSYVKDALRTITLAKEMLIFFFFLFLNDKQDLKFAWTYPKPPTVLVTAKHSTSGANVDAECNGIVSWIEVKKK